MSEASMVRTSRLMARPYRGCRPWPPGARRDRQGDGGRVVRGLGAWTRSVWRRVERGDRVSVPSGPVTAHARGEAGRTALHPLPLAGGDVLELGSLEEIAARPSRRVAKGAQVG